MVPANVTALVFELSWASALGTLVAVFAIKSSGKRRFRGLWREEHSAPNAFVNPNREKRQFDS